MEVVRTKTVMFKIDYPPTKAGKTAWNRRYGLNAYYAGKHWAIRKKDAEYWHTITRAAVRECIKKPVMFDKPVAFTYWFNSQLDLSNCSSFVKLIEDGTKDLLIHDDSRKYVKQINMLWHNEDYILVKIQEIDA